MNKGTAYVDCRSRRQLADFRPYLQIDQVVINNGRFERQGNTIRLIFNRNGAIFLRDWNGKFTTGQEPGCFTGKCRQVGLSQNGQKSFFIKRIDDVHHVHITVLITGKKVRPLADPRDFACDRVSNNVGTACEPEKAVTDIADNFPVDAKLLGN